MRLHTWQTWPASLMMYVPFPVLPSVGKELSLQPSAFEASVCMWTRSCWVTSEASDLLVLCWPSCVIAAGESSSCAQVWPEGLNGIEVKVEGFSHKLPLLTTSIVQQLVSLKVSEAIDLVFQLFRSSDFQRRCSGSHKTCSDRGV